MGKYDPAPTLAAGLIRLARDKAGMTQTQLATNAGVSQQAISAYETGRKDPTVETLRRLVAGAGFELRLHLERMDLHDSSLADYLESLPPATRAEIEKKQRERVEAARLERVRGR